VGHRVIGRTAQRPLIDRPLRRLHESRELGHGDFTRRDEERRQIDCRFRLFVVERARIGSPGRAHHERAARDIDKAGDGLECRVLSRERQ
jgi:hypothetical protein